MSPREQAPEVVDRLLGPRDVADWLDVPLQTVYAWRHRSEGPPGFKVGRHVRYRRADVEAWLDRQASNGSAA